jgi:hypothetical protein
MMTSAIVLPSSSSQLDHFSHYSASHMSMMPMTHWNSSDLDVDFEMMEQLEGMIL